MSAHIHMIHAHTDTHMHTNKVSHMYGDNKTTMHTFVHIYITTHTHMQILMYTYNNTNTHAHTYRDIHTKDLHMHTLMHTCIQDYIQHRHACPHLCTDTSEHRHTQAFITTQNISCKN